MYRMYHYCMHHNLCTHFQGESPHVGIHYGGYVDVATSIDPFYKYGLLLNNSKFGIFASIPQKMNL